MPGHDSGHAGYSWAELVAFHKEAASSWVALADALVHRARDLPDAPEDVASVEKGLRRLAKKKSGDGGQYGRWLLRLFGLPPDVVRYVQRLGQYHRRFADLPTPLRRDQLQLWEATPVMHTPSAAWIHLGLASVLLRQKDEDACIRRLGMAERLAEKAGPLAQIEAALLRARLLTFVDRATAVHRLDEAEAALARLEAKTEDDDEDAACLRARLVGQRAFLLLHAADDADPDVKAALTLFEQSPARPHSAFVSYQRCAGLAHCRFKLGQVDDAVTLAREAAEHAADGGLVRFRVMAFNQLARMLEGEAARAATEKAARMVRLLEDEDLSDRVDRASR